jgi:hypothetical protein
MTTLACLPTLFTAMAFLQFRQLELMIKVAKQAVSQLEVSRVNITPTAKNVSAMRSTHVLMGAIQLPSLERVDTPLLSTLMP